MVDVGFVCGGMVDLVVDIEVGIVLLGSLFFELIWIFYCCDFGIVCC